MEIATVLSAATDISPLRRTFLAASSRRKLRLDSLTLVSPLKFVSHQHSLLQRNDPAHANIDNVLIVRCYYYGSSACVYLIKNLDDSHGSLGIQISRGFVGN